MGVGKRLFARLKRDRGWRQRRAHVTRTTLRPPDDRACAFADVAPRPRMSPSHMIKAHRHLLKNGLTEHVAGTLLSPKHVQSSSLSLAELTSLSAAARQRPRP